jgi:NADP-dependent aldehyde dehydrogenase
VSRVLSHDPRTGQSHPTEVEESTPAEVEAAAARARDALSHLSGYGRAGRASLLHRLAKALDAHGASLIALADQETGLGRRRLGDELVRTSKQLHMHAELVASGTYLGTIIDRGNPSANPAVPDLRRILMPLGVVAVFAASNFPFAFSVFGGDVAAALAAGCPVIVKGHPGHPALTVKLLEIWHAVAESCDAPDDALQVVFGDAAGRQLVEHPVVQAVSFTGSLQVGRLLYDVAASRPQPIPFFGELSGTNPLVVTPGAAAARADDIGHGVVSSFTLNGGQFCTKPGLIFVPDGADGDRLVDAAVSSVHELVPAVMLTERTRDSYRQGLERLTGLAATLARVPVPAGEGGYLGEPALLGMNLAEVDPAAIEECFGPVAIIVRYGDVGELLECLSRLEGALAGAIHGTDAEADLVASITHVLEDKAGRVVFDGYPTGVVVTGAMTHGGPWPATTNSQHSSVGPTAIRRFLRPVSYQNAPRYALPPELRDKLDAIEPAHASSLPPTSKMRGT